MIDYILFALFVLPLLHYLIFLTIIYSGLNKLNDQPVSKIPLPEFISIIVPFRNETENIINCYNSLINQNYPAEMFEIVFVNDFSTDDSFNKLSKVNNLSKVKIISVPDSYSVNAHKKRAIRYGIENAKGEIIITTDADCVHGSDWLISLTSFFDDKTGFVSGPVEFENGDTLFEKFQNLEFAGLVITGAGLIGAGKPTICNAANIAYRKKVFDEVGGFSFQMNLSSGDDELLMQKISKDSDYLVKFAAEKSAIVKTSPNRTVNEFYQQRKRWASKGLFYSDKNLVIKLILIYAFYISFPVQLFLGLVYSKLFLITFLISFLFKVIFEYAVIQKGTNILFNKRILHSFFIIEILQIFYIIIAGISGAFGNYVWKNRKINR